jgi:hypothetical protein
MRGAFASRSLSTPVEQPLPRGHDKTLRIIRGLIWTYFVLLLVEGALRKWVIPQFSDPILVIRDPVLLAIYFFAIKAGVFPRNAWVIALGIIGGLGLVVSILVLYPYIPFRFILPVTLYGFRSNFLHLPLIFVIASVFDHEDVKKFGWWVLLLMIPMAVLMVAQFKASPDAFINRAVGTGEAQQLTTAGGKIRPPGTFSFISGPIFFAGATAAFAIYGVLARGTYNRWLLVLSSTGLLTSVAVSGSRGYVIAVVIVVMSILLILVIRPQVVNKFASTLLIIVIAAVLISRIPIFKEGVGVLSERFTASAEAGETSVVGGMIERVLGEFTEGLSNLDKFPLSGYGLGLGTAGGARLLVGRGTFLLSENEWTRILLESGPILGLAFLIWRMAFTVRLFWLSVTALRRNLVLPILLFSSGFVGLLNGQLGQPTTLGFAVLLGGLCLAATHTKEEAITVDSAITQQPVIKPLPRRSVHASRLYGPGNPPARDHTNGSVDR